MGRVGSDGVGSRDWLPKSPTLTQVGSRWCSQEWLRQQRERVHVRGPHHGEVAVVQRGYLMRRRVTAAARHLQGAQVLAGRIYGVGPSPRWR